MYLYYADLFKQLNNSNKKNYGQIFWETNQNESMAICLNLGFKTFQNNTLFWLAMTDMDPVVSKVIL